MRLNLIVSIFAVAMLLAGCAENKPPAAGGTGTGETTQGGGQPGAVQGKEIVPGSQEDLVANYGDRIFFDFDKSDIRTDARTRLDGWADWLNKYPQATAVIEGHCDERGTREYNLALGERRANAAKSYLVAKGIDAKRLQTISYGKERPAVVGSNEAAWSQNRRAVLVVQ